MYNNVSNVDIFKRKSSSISGYG